MQNLNWKRGKVTGNNGQGTHTTYTATLSSGREVMVKSVEGTFFFYVEGKATGGFTDTLRGAKAAFQRVQDQMTAIV